MSDPNTTARPAAARARGTSIRWLRARVAEALLETRTARTLVLDVPGWRGHDAGQHVEIRLTAEDGYMAQRSYWIGSADARDRLELTVQKVPEGEVSPYLVETVEVGDVFELRGPVGGWFGWTKAVADPVLLIGGGSGIVPLMAMVRARVHAASNTPFHLIYLARTPDHVFYANELFRIATSPDDVQVDLLFTRAGLPADARRPGRLTSADLPMLDESVRDRMRTYICGPNGFVEGASQLLLALGHPAAMIRTERSGSAGG